MATNHLRRSMRVFWKIVSAKDVEARLAIVAVPAPDPVTVRFAGHLQAATVRAVWRIAEPNFLKMLDAGLLIGKRVHISIRFMDLFLLCLHEHITKPITTDSEIFIVRYQFGGLCP